MFSAHSKEQIVWEQVVMFSAHSKEQFKEKSRAE